MEALTGTTRARRRRSYLTIQVVPPILRSRAPDQEIVNDIRNIDALKSRTRDWGHYDNGADDQHERCRLRHLFSHGGFL